MRPSSDDQAKATSPAPVPRITAWSPAVAAWAIPPAHRSGSNGAACPARRRASRIQIEVTDGCAQSPSPSPRVRTRSPQAVDRPIARAVPGSGSLAQVAPPSLDDQAIPRSPAAPPAPTATTVPGSATTSAIGPTPPGSGIVDQRPGEIRRRTRHGGGRRRVAGRGDGDRRRCRLRPRRWSPSGRRSPRDVPQPARARAHDERSQGPGEAAPAVEVGHARGTPLEPGT